MNFEFYRLRLQNPSSGLLRIVHKSKIWQCCHDLLTWCYRQFLLKSFVSLLNFSYWSKFHVNIIADSGVMKLLLIWDWPETEYPHPSFAQNLETGSVRDIFGTNVYNKMFLNTAKCQGYRFYNFYRFWVIKGNQQPKGG